ncbi:MAG: arsenate reductase (glutaredoxin) [Maribacter sp.]
MIKIYHNPRCKKSREGLAILENSGKPFEVIGYLDGSLSKKELKQIIEYLEIKPIQLIRKNESVWKENYKDKALTDNEVVAAMILHPKLIERPIVVHNNKAVIGRPAARIKSLIA